jgi:hypothetical protein
MNRAILIALGQSAALLCLSVSLAHAQAGDEADPPDRVARLSYVQGDVSMQPAGTGEWTAAEVNRPLTTGDRLWTEPGARAELHVGAAAIRLGDASGFSFLNLDDNTIQMRMTAGTMNVRVRSLDQNDQVEIDTPNLALSLLRPGNYRVEVNDAGDTTVVKVSEGEAEATGGDQNVVVHAQQSATFTGVERLAADFGSLGAPDSFDRWSLDRDRREQRAQSAPAAQYVSPDVVGYEDLDDNGTWSSVPEYGYVWTPTHVEVGWSPYRFGRWVWVAPWGWTWIDDAPWGFAPFHYGRWAHVSSRWCWVPGPRHVRAVYAPALVAWVGGSHFDASISIGGGGAVAWFPLGPREVYVPAYRVSPRYVQRVNISNTTVNNTYITNVYNNKVTNIQYRNRSVPGAVMAVPRNAFTSAERVGRHAIRVDEREFARATANTAAPAIQPVRESRLGTSEAARRSVRTPPAALLNRPVVAKRTPPRATEHLVRIPERTTPADRLHRLEDHPARDSAAVRNQPAVRDVPGARNAPATRDVPAARDLPRARDVPGAHSAPAVREQPAVRDSAGAPAQPAFRADRPNPAQTGRPDDVAAERQRSARDRAEARPDRPAHIDRPASVDRPANLEHPARVERPAHIDRPAQTDRPTQFDRPAVNRPAQAERPAHVDRPAQNERPANMERERPARAERVEPRPQARAAPNAMPPPPRPPAQVDRPAKPEKPAHGEQADRLKQNRRPANDPQQQTP